MKKIKQTSKICTHTSQRHKEQQRYDADWSLGFAAGQAFAKDLACASHIHSIAMRAREIQTKGLYLSASAMLQELILIINNAASLSEIAIQLFGEPSPTPVTIRAFFFGVEDVYIELYPSVSISQKKDH